MSIFEIIYLSICFPALLLVIILFARVLIKLKRMEKILLDTAKETLSKEDYKELLNIIHN